MPHYRLEYRVTETGPIEKTEIIEAADDLSASAVASARSAGYASVNIVKLEGK